ncbi:F0F1 ATP synthase subunit gamma [Luteolibacter pohnpeiensis]|uniref:F0F1 ATP synthase subunit gamma n=1 Tax=Luteolibacter pohnpeiensis TaxID=454153 RepID=A0A934VRC2_9BACT|nr:F0F1 ATP synthase subunit gamma [Luteolibacter pohnpeiensis]MBK1883041.1 F0F1 ATP synthase subunit gamma [Luteolibacter pohnpeiensis]
MSETTASLQRKIQSADDLRSVVRTMKALAASSIGQYEASVRSLADYHRHLELGLGVCLRQRGLVTTAPAKPTSKPPVIAIVFGSDQGLVGSFNDNIADFAVRELSTLTERPQVLAIGERVHTRLADAGLSMLGPFPVPNSVKAIAPLIAQIQLASEHHTRADTSVYLFHHRPKNRATYEPNRQRLLPLDSDWQSNLAKSPWPTPYLPEVLPDALTTLPALVGEYLFISLFRACAESLASENASRLNAMQRAEKNIDELVEKLHGDYNSLRQSSIDEELFDLVAGYNHLSEPD